MSTHPAVILLCDFGEECEDGQIVSPSTSTTTARSIAADKGWKSVGDHDYCPDHRAEFYREMSREENAHHAKQ